MSPVQVGNAGEHYVMACLLARGDLAGLAAGGNPHFDILVRTSSGDFWAVRVKTASDSTFQWSAKESRCPRRGACTGKSSKETGERRSKNVPLAAANSGSLSTCPNRRRESKTGGRPANILRSRLQRREF